jgi:hypothetical protein
MIKVQFSLLPAKATAIMRKKPLVLIVISLVLVGTSIAAASSPAATNKATSPKSEDYQRELLGAVDTTVGTPQNGRDPASQPQNSLASAASKPEGPGQRVAKPAANVSGSHDHHDVSAKQTGVTSGGCIIGYGNAGQCLATTGHDQDITCEYVHEKGFHHGLAVTGDDHLHLDKNNDKTACGHDD